MDDEETIRAERSDARERCGPYELVRELGRGGMGSVWEGRHTTLDRRVALKIIRGEFVRNPELLARFLREGKAAARLDHPHVARVFDVGQDDDRAWLVMELLEGEDLKALLDRERKLDVARTLDVFLPVLAGMVAAHAASVVHRDLKPGNIFLARDRTGALVPKVVDFGLSKIRSPDAGDEPDLTRPDTALGTLQYAAVEQLLDSRNAGPGCDQYALGVTLYRCLTGSLPYDGPTSAKIFSAVLKGVCARPRELEPSIPEGLEAVVLRAMHKEAGQRFPSVLALGASLVPFASPAAQARWGQTFGAMEATAPAMSVGSVVSVTETSLRAPTVGAAPKRGAKITLVALAVLVAAGVAIWFAMR